MSLDARLEVVEARSGYKIDILLHVEGGGTPLGESGGGGGGGGEGGGRLIMPVGWLIEVDGPSHFLQGACRPFVCGSEDVFE